MKKLIWITECFLFALILVQINTLASYTTKDPGQTMLNNPVITAQAIEQMYDSKAPRPDPYMLSTQIKDPQNLQFLAQKEAEHIINTGDVTELREQIDKNSGVLRLLGYSTE
jgi:hypothetical protein